MWDLAPGADFISGNGVNFASPDLSFRNGLREVELLMSELMAKKIDITWGVTKFIAHGLGGQSIYERRPQGFIPPLPFMNWM